GGLHHHVDGVALRRFDEAARVHQDGVGGFRISHEVPPVAGEIGRQLLGVHLIACTTERDDGDRRPGHGWSPPTPRRSAITAGRSSGVTSTSRAFEPSLGPTTPRTSSRSISRPAFAKPTRSLRCNIDVEPNWVLTI